MNQIVLGASIPFLIALVIYIAGKFRASLAMLVATPLAMALFALWAIAPDIPRLFGLNELYYSLARDPRTNIFFWHYTIDLKETDSPVFFTVFVLMCLSVLFALWREVSIAEKEI